VGPHPYSDAASDLSAANSVAQALGEHHEESLLARRVEGGSGRLAGLVRSGHGAAMRDSLRRLRRAFVELWPPDA
jgi:hypothetical protein